MTCSITLTFESFEDLIDFTTQFKSFKEKQFRKKEKGFIDVYSNMDNLKEDKIDKRGQHQIVYHNLAKEYQKSHPELSYRDSLKYIYKNNKVNEKTV